MSCFWLSAFSIGFHCFVHVRSVLPLFFNRRIHVSYTVLTNALKMRRTVVAHCAFEMIEKQSNPTWSLFLSTAYLELLLLRFVLSNTTQCTQITCVSIFHLLSSARLMILWHSKLSIEFNLFVVNQQINWTQLSLFQILLVTYVLCTISVRKWFNELCCVSVFPFFSSSSFIWNQWFNCVRITHCGPWISHIPYKIYRLD